VGEYLRASTLGWEAAGVTMPMNFVQAFIMKDGRPMIPRFTVQSVWDDDAKFTYWIVNLHDFVVGEGTMFTIKLFHDEASVLTFAAEELGKPQ